jgi:hypothetical protein
MLVPELPEELQSRLEDNSLLRFAGEMDVKNRYASTVMLSLKDPMALPDCSGLLLAPRLVLTAGSCVCGLSTVPPQGGDGGSRAAASSCEERILVTAIVYGQVGNPKRKELTTDMQFHTVAGTVRPHPELELILGKRGGLVGSRADLAVILLDEPMDEEWTEVALARNEVQKGESLIMAGYGHDELVGGCHGVRYFRRNKVLEVRSSKGDRILYEQQGAAAYNGYDGGPCLREEGERRELVGVASARAQGELVCTSTTAHRDWLLTELRRAQGHKDGGPSGR